MNIRWDPAVRRVFREKLSRKKTELTLSQKVEKRLTALQKEDKTTDGSTVSVSPEKSMSTVMTILGWLGRAILLFAILYGTGLFLCDALRLVTLTGKRPISEVVLTTKYLAGVSALIAVYLSACAWNRLTRWLGAFVGLGGGAIFLCMQTSNPLRYLFEAIRMTADVALDNLAQIGYTAYVKYSYTGSYVYGNKEALVKLGVALLLLCFGILFAIGMLRRVRPILVSLLIAIEMVPVFMFNITETNKGLAWLLVAIWGLLCLWFYDCRYAVGQERALARAAQRKEKKAAKKAARLAKKDEKAKRRMREKLAYLTVIRDGGRRKEARKARAALCKAEKQRKKAEKERLKKLALTQKKEQKEARLATKKAKKEAKVAVATKKRSLNGDKAALTELREGEKAAKNALREEKQSARKTARAARQEKLLQANRKIAGGGFAAVLSMVVAVVAIWLPTQAIEENFPIIDAINNRMQIARMYVTAYLMGDDVDLNSLSLYGGVSELNPRTVSFDSPQFTGQRVFTVDAGYASPVYLRSWMGQNYDIETDTWTSADADAVLDYRSRFGSTFTPDSITTAFNGYVYPKSVDITRFDQYRNLDSYGFRVFQINVRRTAGSSKLLFVPATMNTNLKLMEYGSITPVKLKYSAYYDGIYSSRFFGIDDGYSTSSFVPVMKDLELGENLEKSILYYNAALNYAYNIDFLETSAEQGIFYVDEDGYTMTNGQDYMTDYAGMVTDFESWAKNDLGYKWEGDSFVYRYLAMDETERKAVWTAHEKELAYREYANETYTETFGSEVIAELAQEILAENNIGMAKRTDEETDRIIYADKKYPDWDSTWFYDLDTMEAIPRHNVILAVVNYLRDNYTYSLEPEVPMTTVVDEEGNETEVPDLHYDSDLEAFLMEVKEGYCVHFATSAVGLLRELGFAVRYTEGYIADGFSRTYATDAVARYRTAVRDNDAHAWIEVYYPDMGWIQYETTPTFCEAIYDEEYVESTTSTSTSTSSSYISSSSTETETEEEEEEEEDYTREILIAIAIVVGLLVLFSVVVWILRKRAERAADKREKLIRQTDDRRDFGRVDVHKTARALIDCLFALFRGLGLPNELGEQPTEYAARLEREIGSLSTTPLTEIMEIIEREEFGGNLTWQELHALGKCLEDMSKGAYAGLGLRQKIRMRYILALL